MALSNTAVIDFATRNYLLNRTIVSDDIKKIFDDIESTLRLPVKRHAYKTGDDCGTWIIPPSWDIKTGWLKDKEGRVIASYQQHPLFVCPYSKSVHMKLSKAELMPHVFSEPRIPDAFGYNWRYAYDARLRLKDWGISLPLNTVKGLDDGPFEVFIDADVKDASMLVGDVFLKGSSDKEFVFVANYCHPGQVNDSFSGMMLFMKVMSALSELKDRKCSYRFLFMPETIGSAAYLSREHGRMKKQAIGTIFSEMITAGEEWYVKNTRSGNAYVDSLANDAVLHFKDIKLSPFLSIYGNDEYIFDSVQSQIPSLSLQKYPFHEYHTNLDDIAHVRQEDLQKAYDITMRMVHILENDAVYAFVHNAPFWMTRYDLFSDDVYERELFKIKFEIVYILLDGKNTVMDIALKLGVDFDVVNAFVLKMHEKGLVKKVREAFADEKN